MERQKDPRSQEVTTPTLGRLLPGFSLQENRKFSKENPHQHYMEASVTDSSLIQNLLPASRMPWETEPKWELGQREKRELWACGWKSGILCDGENVMKLSPTVPWKCYLPRGAVTSESIAGKNQITGIRWMLLFKIWVGGLFWVFIVVRGIFVSTQ